MLALTGALQYAVQTIVGLNHRILVLEGHPPLGHAENPIEIDDEEEEEGERESEVEEEEVQEVERGRTPSPVPSTSRVGQMAVRTQGPPGQPPIRPPVVGPSRAEVFVLENTPPPPYTREWSGEL